MFWLKKRYSILIISFVIIAYILESFLAFSKQLLLISEYFIFYIFLILAFERLVIIRHSAFLKSNFIKNSSWLYRVPPTNSFCTYEHCHLPRDDLLNRVTRDLKLAVKMLTLVVLWNQFILTRAKKCEVVKMSYLIICWFCRYLLIFIPFFELM